MDAVLFSSPTWFYIDSDGQERGPFSAADMLEWYSNGYFPGTVMDWYRNGFFPAKLAVRPNIHSIFTTLSSLALEHIDIVHPAPKRQKVEEKLSETSGTEHDEECVEQECFKQQIKEEYVKPEIKDECFKLEIKEECVKTEIKTECLKSEIQKEYLKPEMKECTKLKIKKEESKLADLHSSESEQEYIETEISKECIKLEVKEEYINHEMKREYIKPEIEKEYANTRHKREVPQSLQNDAKSCEGKNKLKRAEHEIYIGNYSVRFRESDVRKLFEDHGINVTTIRLKHNGLKVFAFAETESLEMIEKAKNAMEGKEINGRKLRVRSSKDKSEREPDRAKKKEAGGNRKRPRGTEREVGGEDIKKFLVAAFIDFVDREIDAAGEDASGEYKGLMDAAKKALAAAYSLPEDDSFKVNKELEDMFLGSVRREIKLPELPKDDKIEDKETNCKSDSKVDEDADDDGNWKRRKVAKDDENDTIRKDEEEETGNEQDVDENDDGMDNLDEGEADTSAPEGDDENEEVEDKMVEDIEDEELNGPQVEDKQDDEENEPSKPSHQPTKGRGRGRGRSSRRSKK